MRRELSCALTLLVLAVTYYAFARNLGETALSDSIGPAGLPLIYAMALAGLAVLLGGAALLQRRRDEAPKVSADAGPVRGLAYRTWRAAGTLLIGIVYLVLVSSIGYPFATALAIAAMAIYQGERVSLRVVLVACMGAAALYALFDMLLGVPMPAPWNG